MSSSPALTTPLRLTSSLDKNPNTPSCIPIVKRRLLIGPAMDTYAEGNGNADEAVVILVDKVGLVVGCAVTFAVASTICRLGLVRPKQ